MNIKALLFRPLKVFLLFQALKELCDPQPLHEVRDEALYQAERDLHRAELTTERSVYERDMLKARVARIKAEIAAAYPGQGTNLDSHVHKGGETRDYVAAEDLASASAVVLRHPGTGCYVGYP